MAGWAANIAQGCGAHKVACSVQPIGFERSLNTHNLAAADLDLLPRLGFDHRATPEISTVAELGSVNQVSFCQLA